jgi:hypothetical protein
MGIIYIMLEALGDLEEQGRGQTEHSGLGPGDTKQPQT